MIWRNQRTCLEAFAVLWKHVGGEKVPGLVQQMALGIAGVAATTEEVRELVGQGGVSVIWPGKPVGLVANPSRIEVLRLGTVLVRGPV